MDLLMHQMTSSRFEQIDRAEAPQAGSRPSAKQAYDPSKLLISLHVPKTAGTSFCTTLKTWFGEDGLRLHYRDADADPVRHTGISARACVHGHFNRVRGIGALAYYPEAQQFITFLRDPFSRFVSQWRYLHFQRRSGLPVPALDDNPTFGQWFDRRAKAASEGEDPFSFLAQLPWPVAPDNADGAFDQGYIAVGILEAYDASVRVLAKALGFQAPQEIIHVNRADDAHRSGDPTEIYGEWQTAHRDAFALEYAVYEAGRRHLFAALPAAAGLSRAGVF